MNNCLDLPIYTWQSLDKAQKEQLLARPAQDNSHSVELAVREIIDNVKHNKDQALREYMQRFDKLSSDECVNIELTQAQIDKACAELVKNDAALCKAIDEAYNNIAKFHSAQSAQAISLTTVNGITCECKSHAIEKVGLYVPGGSAPLVSTALMLGVPAQIAQCKEVILCSPGPISNAIIYAASKCNIKRIFKLGGAHAIAAMAFGSESVPKVYKIFGPGNQYVTKAKQLVCDLAPNVTIDMPAGPSEVLVIADKNADASFIASDLLSQAEHGADSQVILVSDSEEQIYKTRIELDRQIKKLPRHDIALSALSKSRLILAQDLDECIHISNQYAPEHLIVHIDNPHTIVDRLLNAGSIFLGAYTCESMGDYASGTNHTLPTYGYATSVSALGTDDFRRRYTISYANQEGLKNIGNIVERLAQAEGLHAHRNAVSIRLKKLGLPTPYHDEI